MLFPEIVSWPEPDFAKLPAPEIIPEYDVVDDWFTVKVPLLILTSPEPWSDATVSEESSFNVPSTSILTVSAKLPSALVKSASAYWLISSVPVPVTKSKNSYTLFAAASELPLSIKVKVLLPRFTAVVVVPPTSLPNCNLPPEIFVLFPLYKTLASALKVTVPKIWILVSASPLVVIAEAVAVTAPFVFPVPAILKFPVKSLPLPIPP